MSPGARRIVIPIVVLALAGGLVSLVVLSRARGGAAPPSSPSPAAAAAPVEAASAVGSEVPETEVAEVVDDDAVAEIAPADLEPLGALRATAPSPGPSTEASDLTPMGSLDPDAAPMEILFSPVGAGIDRITLSDQWVTAEAKVQADEHRRDTAAGAASPTPLPDDDQRLVLAQTESLRGTVVPVLAAHSIEIDGQLVYLLYDVDPDTGARRHLWREVAPGTFETTVVGEGDRPVLRITRSFVVKEAGDVALTQRVDNLSGRPLSIRWRQFGPSDLRPDRSGYIDRRRFRFGHLFSPEVDPSRQVVRADKGLLEERNTILKNLEDPIWPTKATTGKGYELSWFAAASRYFTLAVHPPLDEQQQGSRAITDVIERIDVDANGTDVDTATIFTLTLSPERRVGAGETLAFDLGVYAGAMERKRLRTVEPYRALGMRFLILYQMSSCCSACTFQWLAEILINFLSWVHAVLGDWGIAIILLVCVVRAVLHPLTKRAQINMHRFSTQMGKLKPELDKLQEKYRDDPKKFQAEQLRLMREHGISPTQFLGCLPMFLQTPIWIALYAMLYFAFEIRQEPAFYGVFQAITDGAWPFLADLSRADRFIPIFDEPRLFKFGLFFDYSSINILPLLMGVLFWIQQKYMTPPPNPGMSKEQIQQQKIMKVMMVVMMPVFLYSAPSGLTLYILTSSTIGILEGRYVRSHIKQMDLNPPEKSAKKSRSRDAMGRAYAAALQRAEQKRREKKMPKKTYKSKRKKR